MRTRLASLIVVKQEPLTNEYIETGPNTLNGHSQYNDVDARFYGLADTRRDSLPAQAIAGDLNNNSLIHREDFIEDKKCTYYHPTTHHILPARKTFHFCFPQTFLFFTVFFGSSVRIISIRLLWWHFHFDKQSISVFL